MRSNSFCPTQGRFCGTFSFAASPQINVSLEARVESLQTLAAISQSTLYDYAHNVRAARPLTRSSTSR